ncbi:MAG: hypothetical protein Q8S13_06890 [Dehalococcoidia bacterium]|nr:hypothetical protein [Dehalococcoidia bacterium]
MAGRGRPTKLTPEIAARIFQALRAGNNRPAAAHYGGISQETFQTWMRRGRAARAGIHRDFLVGVEKAEADAQIASVAIIQSAARKTWQAAAWWLERKFPQEWGRRERMEVSGPDGGPIPLADLGRLSDAKLVTLRELVAEAMLALPEKAAS